MQNMATMRVLINGRAIDLPKGDALKALNEGRATVPRRNTTHPGEHAARPHDQFDVHGRDGTYPND